MEQLTDDLTRDYFSEHDPTYDDDNYNIESWRLEMVNSMEDLLEEREIELLLKGPDSLASSWRIMGLKKEWESMIDAGLV